MDNIDRYYLPVNGRDRKLKNKQTNEEQTKNQGPKLKQKLEKTN